MERKACRDNAGVHSKSRESKIENLLWLRTDFAALDKSAVPSCWRCSWPVYEVHQWRVGKKDWRTVRCQGDLRQVHYGCRVELHFQRGCTIVHQRQAGNPRDGTEDYATDNLYELHVPSIHFLPIHHEALQNPDGVAGNPGFLRQHHAASGRQP